MFITIFLFLLPTKEAFHVHQLSLVVATTAERGGARPTELCTQAVRNRSQAKVLGS